MRRFTTRRPMVLVAARPDVPQSPVPARRAVGAPEARPGTADAGHVPHEDDLGRPAATPRCRRPTTTPTCRSRTLWGERLYDVTHSLDRLLRRTRQQGKLANVVMVDPGFQFAQRTDDHPVGDIRAGQRWLRSVFQAFAQSPQWERGAVPRALRRVGWVLRPREAADAPGTPAKARSTAGSRSSGSASPRSSRRRSLAPGYADHTVYDHTSVLRTARVALPRRPPRRAPRPASAGSGG